MSIRNPARAGLAVLAAALLLGSTTACGLEKFVGGGPKETAGPARTSPAKAAPKRVQGAYTTPITYRPAGAQRYEITKLGGRLKLDGQRPAEFFLGFSVDEPAGGTHPLVQADLRFWRQKQAKVSRFSAGEGEGYWAQTQVTADKEQGTPAGTSLFYVLAKDTIAVTLSVFVRQGGQITAVQRRMADRLIRSVRFDPSKLTGMVAGGRQPEPVVPFSYERPPGLSGGEQATDGQEFFTTLHYGQRQRVEIGISSFAKEEQARATYTAEKRELADFPVRLKNVKTAPVTASTLGRQVDEGYGLVVRQKGIGLAVEDFLVRRKGLLFAVTTRRPKNTGLTRRTEAGVAGILTTAKFRRPAL